MNALTKIENTALQAMTETELIEVLQSSLYPGAKLGSIKMVLGYCRASGLDPMKKPVHIVPMKVSTGQKDANGWDIKETRDVIMPGVGMYRTEASRTGQYAGVSEPEFGPMQDLEYTVEVWTEGDGGRRQKRADKKILRYPEWCRVTVERIVDGSPRQFTAKEYWLENYATKGNSGAPNEMWAKRPMGQLSKCAEAQALRKAFPDTTGAQPTADEMEGKDQDQPGERHMGAAEVVQPPAPPAGPAQWPDDKLDERKAHVPKFQAAGKTADEMITFLSAKGALSDEQKARVRGWFKPAAAEAQDATIKVSYAALADRLHKCEDRDTAVLIVDEGRALPADQQQDLAAIFTSKFQPQG